MTIRLEPVSNAETWTDQLEFIDDETGTAWFAQASPPTEITINLRDTQTGETVLSGSLTGGQITIVQDGVAEYTFAPSLMSALDAKTYEVGVLYTDQSITRQAVLGTIAVLRGL